MSTVEITGRSTPARRDRLAWVEVDGEVVVADEDTGRLHLLNPTAAVVFQCLDGASSLAEIAGDIADVLGTDPSAVEGDVVALAGQLADLDLVVRR